MIIQDDCVAVFERHRDGRRYYVFPGGGIEAGETPEEAAIREAWEELGLRVAIDRLLARVTWEQRAGSLAEAQLLCVFLAEIVAGAFGTGRGLEMTGGRPERGTYAARWLPIAELLDRPVYPRSVAQLVYAAATAGWPTHAVDLLES